MRSKRHVSRKPIPATARPASTTAPIRGLNTRDPLAAMDPLYAVAVQNFIATPQGMQVREGYTKHVTGIDGWVTSQLVYKGVSTSQDRLFACAGSNIYDATFATSTPTAVQTGLLNGYWEHVNMSVPGGHFMVACNSADTARFYNGSTWTNFSLATTPSAPGQITTGTMTNLEDWKQVIVHQRRLWITHPNSTIAHYLPVNSLGGAAAAFDFGTTFPRGGSIAAMASMSVDMGLGLTQYLVVTSTSGDVSIYAGTNPADAATWALAGTWQLAEPVGVRSLYQWRSDLLTLSQDGLLELSTALKSTRVDNAAAMSLAIQPTIAQLVSTYGSLPGFEMVAYPGKNLLILNVPQINAEANFQFVYNTITGGWTQFTNWPAQCWAYLNNSLYFGGDGYIAKAFNGFKDNAEVDGSGGDSYVAYVQQAFDYFELPGTTKYFQMARPNLSTAVATPQVYVNCNTDFSLRQPYATASVPPSESNVWDVAIWDVSTWGYGGQNYNEWQTINGIGYCASLTMAISVNDYTLWASTDWSWTPGGTIG